VQFAAQLQEPGSPLLDGSPLLALSSNPDYSDGSPALPRGPVIVKEVNSKFRNGQVLDYSADQQAPEVASPGQASPDIGGADGGSPSVQGSSPSPIKIREMISNTSTRYNREIRNQSLEQRELGPDAPHDEAGIETATPQEGSVHHQQERSAAITAGDPVK
jgi:hypothetical protein